MLSMKIQKIVFAVAAGLCAGIAAAQTAPEMDSARGEQLFRSLSCVQCHSIRGEGGKTGPDLTKGIARNLTPEAFISAMWNHAPAMWAAMRERGMKPDNLNAQGAADLFAYFYSLHFFDKPGDAGRGKHLFETKHCASCHGLTQPVLPAAKPVAQWEATYAPIALVDAMWNHSAKMHEEFTRRKLRWPELTSQDLTDILLYLRNSAGKSTQTSKLVLGSRERGQAVFAEKGCAGCHTGKLALETRLHERTLTDLAVDMWNHAPKMANPAPQLEVQEMRDVTTYLWSQQFFMGQGSVAAGRKIFAAKKCTTCHPDGPQGLPVFTSGQSLWAYGPQMLDQMTAKGISWPHLDSAETANLLAYISAARASNKK
jgi:mono/diheme cytochrome c family protein